MRWLWRVVAPLILFVFVGARHVVPLQVAHGATANISNTDKDRARRASPLQTDDTIYTQAETGVGAHGGAPLQGDANLGAPSGDNTRARYILPLQADGNRYAQGDADTRAHSRAPLQADANLYIQTDETTAQVTGTPEATANPAWCVSVWYPSASAPGGLDSIQKNDDLISVVNPFWYQPTADGHVVPLEQAESPDQLAAWRADKLLIIPTIYGNTWQMLNDPTTLAYHIDQIVSLVSQLNYDGIDIDYESFPLATRDEFSTFIEQLSAKMHANHKLLTVAVHPKTDDAGTWYGAAAQDWTRIAPAVDVLTIMTYDYTDRNQPPGPISPPDWVHDVLTYAASVTDLHKVHMGLPFYGYTWTRDNPPATTTDWVSVNRLIQTFKPTVERDPNNMETQIELKVRGLPKQTIYVEDSTAIRYKMQQILSAFPDLGGVGIWGIGGEDPADWDVLRAARQANCTLRSLPLTPNPSPTQAGREAKETAVSSDEL